MEGRLNVKGPAEEACETGLMQIVRPAFRDKSLIIGEYRSREDICPSSFQAKFPKPAPGLFILKILLCTHTFVLHFKFLKIFLKSQPCPTSVSSAG